MAATMRTPATYEAANTIAQMGWPRILLDGLGGDCGECGMAGEWRPVRGCIAVNEERVAMTVNSLCRETRGLIGRPQS